MYICTMQSQNVTSKPLMEAFSLVVQHWQEFQKCFVFHQASVFIMMSNNVIKTILTTSAVCSIRTLVDLQDLGGRFGTDFTLSSLGGNFGGIDTVC